MRENGRNSVRRPRIASLTDRNCEGFCRRGNRGGLPGLHGGAEGIRTGGHRSLAASNRRSSLTNIKVSYGQIASANYVSTFVHKPQSSLAFCLSKSNGRVKQKIDRSWNERTRKEMEFAAYAVQSNRADYRSPRKSWLNRLNDES